MSDEIDVLTYGPLFLAPGQEETWIFGGNGFDSAHWVRFDAIPESDQSRITITEQASDKGELHEVTIWVRFRNDRNDTSISFFPRAVVAPTTD